MATMMQPGMSTSKVIILVGAGLTSSVILRSGRLPDIVSELQELLKGVKHVEISSTQFDSAFLATQIRQLAQEVRELTFHPPVTVFNGNSESNGTLASYIVPAAALGAMGYCYMWWKGWSLSDVMFVTRRHMANAAANISKQLEQVYASLASTKRYLTQQLENLDEKLDEEKELSKHISNEVNDLRSDLSQISCDIEFIQKIVSGLDEKIGVIESKQDFTNSGLWYLCHIAGGIKDGFSVKFFQDPGAKIPIDQMKPTYSEDKSPKGLQFIADTMGVGNSEKSVPSLLRKNLPIKAAANGLPTKTALHRSYPANISLTRVT